MSDYPRILIFAVYFGRLPPYFPFWLESCAENPKINWALITDAATDQFAIPQNVVTIKMTLAELAQIFSTHLGFEVTLRTPYKCCDFRPLFSCLLQLVPGAWDFWGHCDIDMVFGNIKTFITPDILLRYDRALGVGHLSIYRNTPEVNLFFKHPYRGIDYQTIFTTPENYGFDEHHGVNLIWRHYRGRFYENELIIADIDPHVQRMTRASNYIPVPNYKAQAFIYNRGTVAQIYICSSTMHSNNLLYIHFQKRRFERFILSEGQYYVTPEGFIPFSELGAPSEFVIARLDTGHISPKEAIYLARRKVRILRHQLLPRLSTW